MSKPRYTDAQAEVIAAASSKVVVSLRWREGTAPDDHELFQVITMRNGKIVAMQDYRRRRRALSALS